MVAFALHSTYHPFNIVSETSLAESDGELEKRANQSECCPCCCNNVQHSEGVILHRMERNSIIISIILLWSAVVFIPAPTGTTGFCHFLATCCIVSLICFNLLFLIWGGRNFFKMLYRVATERRLAREATSKDGSLSHAGSMRFRENPAFNVELMEMSSSS